MSGQLANASHFVTLTEKVKMIEMQARGDSINDIARVLQRGEKTIKLWLTRWNRRESLNVCNRSGRPIALDLQTQFKLVAKVQTNPTFTAKELKSSLSLDCSERTITNFLNRSLVNSYKAGKKPFHFPHHREARILFSEILLQWKSWPLVIFTDESSFYNHRSCSRRVWRPKGVDAPVGTSQVNATTRIKINVWGAISKNGIESLRLVSDHLTGQLYFEEIRKVLETLRPKYPNLVWMQDNASIHRSPALKQYFEESGIQKMMWPARSPDMNPIENVWGIITQKMDKMIDATKREATSENELFERVQQSANEIEPTVFLNLYKSLRKRLQLVIENQGNAIKY